MNLVKCAALGWMFGAVAIVSMGAAPSATASALTASPSSLTFAGQAIGTVSAQQQVTLSNSGSEAIVFSSIGLTGANAGDFEMGTNCGNSLGAGDSCTLFLSFTPSAVGTRKAAVTVSGDWGDSPLAVPLRGTGLKDLSSVTVSPAALNFGSQYLTTTSNYLVSLVTNTGAFNVNFSAVGVSGKNASDFAVDASQCGATLAVGSSCNLIVTFAPSGSGARVATITLADDAAGSPQKIALSGTGVLAVTTLSFNATAFDFGPQNLGTSSLWNLAVSSNGSVGTTFTSVSLSGPNAGDFSISGNTCQGAQYFCGLTVTFVPGGIGPRSAVLSFSDSAVGSPQTVTLSGTGQAVTTTLSVSPKQVNFGALNLTQISPAQTVTLTNTGTTAITLGTTAIVGANAADFLVSDDTFTGNACTNSLAVGGTCTVSLTFSPKAVGPRAATLQIASDAKGSPQSIALTGRGLPTSTLLFSPSAISFNKIKVGASASRSMTITNAGAGATSIDGFGFSGITASDFAISGNTCPIAPAVLSAGGNCSLTITFTPMGPGPRTSDLVIVDSAANSPQLLYVGGNGAEDSKTLAFDAIPIAFGNALVGSSSSPMVFTITNTGNAEIHIASIAISGANGSEFSIYQNDCANDNSSVLSPGVSCNVYLSFSPKAAGPRQGLLTFVDNANNSPQSLAMTGNGVTAGVSASTGIVQVVYGLQDIGTTSDEQDISLQNTGNEVLNVSSITITGENSADFRISTNQCGAMAMLAAGQQCYVGVVFTPRGSGNRVAYLNFNDNAPQSPQTVLLSGSGAGSGSGPVQSAALLVSPPALFFGGQLVGTSTPLLPYIAISNTGTATVNIKSVTITGTNAKDFTSYGGCAGSLAAGATCSFAVNFDPSAAGNRTATIEIVNDSADSPLSVPVSGVGTTESIGLAAVPANLAFSEAVGQTSAPQSVTLLNTGSEEISLSSIAITGPADYAIISNTCAYLPSTIDYGYGCTIQITYTPSAAGTSTATLGIASNAGNQTILLTGSGQSAAKKLTAAASIAFNTQSIGTTSLAQAVTLQNAGSLPISLTGFAISGKNANDFTIDANGCLEILNAGQACTIGVTFTPAASGARTAMLAVTDDAPGSPQSITLNGSGEGSQKTVALSLTALSFGAVNVGTASIANALQITNTGLSSVSLTSYSITGANSGDFTISQNTCQATFANVLPPSAICNLYVVFRPSAQGERSAALQIGGDASGSPQTIVLDGAGESVVRTIALSQPSLSFALTNVGSSTSGSFTITNTGDAPVTFASFAINGANATDFAVSGNLCSGSALASQASCNVTIGFAPSLAGLRSASLQIASNAGGSAQTVLLEGTGQSVVKTLAVTPTSIDLGISNIGISATNSFTITNTGTANVTIGAATVSGKNAADFAVNVGQCSGSTPNVVPPGTYCVGSITFTPSGQGIRTATAFIPSDAGLQSVSLTGFGQKAIKSLTISLASYDFGATVVGASSVWYGGPYVTNTGNAPVTIQNITLTGKNAGDYALTGSSCASALPAGSSCFLTLTFTPSAPGVRSAILSFIDDASGNPQTITLSGTGQAVSSSLQVLPADLPLTSTVGSSSAPQYVYINNSGNTTIPMPSFTITGANPADFAIASNGCAYSSTLPAETGCSVAITFTPSAPGVETAHLNVADSALSTPQTTLLYGLGQTLQRFVEVSSDTVLFGMAQLNTTSQYYLQLTTEGDGAVTIASIAITGANASEFSFQNGQNCQTGTAFSGICYIPLQFTPAGQGYRTATLQIVDNATGSVQNVILGGYGFAAESIWGGGALLGSIPLNTASPQSHVTFQNLNASGPAIKIGAPALVGPDAADFSISSTNCAATLSPNASCSVYVTFKPSAAGPRVAAIQLTEAGGATPLADAMLGGDGQGGAGYVALQQLGVEFNNTNVNSGSDNQSVQITNTGTNTVHFNTFTFVGKNAQDFGFASNGCAGALSPGANCYLNLDFTPAATGLRSGALQISSDAKNSPQTLALVGLGQSATEILNASVAGLDFGSAIVNGGSSTASVALDSEGTLNVTLGNIQITGTNASEFTFINSACASILTSSCTMELQFAPTGLGPRNANLVITSDAPGSPLTIPLTGSGQPATMSFSLSNVNLDFGVENIDAQNVLSVTVTNEGNSPVQLVLPSISGANAGEFVIASNSCGNLPVGYECSIGVAFSPSAAGVRTAALEIRDSAGLAQSVALYGVGQIRSQMLSASTSEIDFGAQTLGLTANDYPGIVIQNTGTDLAILSGIAITGANAADFQIIPFVNPCGSPVPSYGCNLELQFTPSKIGVESAALNIAYGIDSHLVIPLVGEGLKENNTVSVSPLALDFGTQTVGGASAAAVINVANMSDGLVNVYTPVILGANAASFAITQNNCSVGYFSAGFSCSIYVTFTPSAAGGVGATLQIPTTANSAPLTVPLTGMGVVN